MKEIDFRKKIHGQRAYDKTDNRFISDARSLQRRFESDRGRIINSAAIRRLQQKTQVFPLEKNAAVRSRLTHSLEVQQVGRFIVQRIYDKLTELQKQNYGLSTLERCIESIVEMSCLMHDIGNPPFGHFGEQAINDWFNEHLEAISCQANSKNSGQSVLAAKPELSLELKSFEGNAQAMRLVHSLLDLNLTYTQSASILKYTRPGYLNKKACPDNKRYLMKKSGYYFSESDFIQQISQSLDIAYGCRHPLSYIMEAADDISYCLADIEDAVEKGILTTEKLSQLLKSTYSEMLTSDKYQLSAITVESAENEMLDIVNAASGYGKSTQNYFVTLRVKLSHPLVNHAATQFLKNLDSIFNGEYDNALLEDFSQYHAITATLKRIAIGYVFCHKEVEQLELQGFRIISGLLDCYKPLLVLTNKAFTGVMKQEKNAPLIAKHLIKKLPEKHLSAYKKVVNSLDQSASNFDYLEYYYRCRLIQDYISGMTDQFAYDEYRMLMVTD